MTALQGPATKPEEHRLLTVTEVARFLNVSEAYIYELAKRGQIPCGKLGRLYRFEKAEIEKWWILRKKG